MFKSYSKFLYLFNEKKYELKKLQNELFDDRDKLVKLYQEGIIDGDRGYILGYRYYFYFSY